MLQVRSSEIIPLLNDTLNSLPSQLSVTTLNMFPRILTFLGFLLYEPREFLPFKVLWHWLIDETCIQTKDLQMYLRQKRKTATWRYQCGHLSPTLGSLYLFEELSKGEYRECQGVVKFREVWGLGEYTYTQDKFCLTCRRHNSLERIHYGMEMEVINVEKKSLLRTLGPKLFCDLNLGHKNLWNDPLVIVYFQGPESV